MYRQAAKFILVVAAAATGATGIFYARSSGPNISPQSVSPPVRPRDKRAAEGIEGHVIDMEGHPIAGAKVFAEIDDAIRSLLMYSTTDKEGNFRIDVPGPGTYIVYGSKEDDRYPLTISSFHQEVDVYVPKVVVAQKQVARDVVVQFGLKASKIEGVIVDAITNRAISKATITLRRTDNPEIYYIIGPEGPKENGRFKALVPSVPFTIEVSSPEYETWTYSKNGLNNRSDSLVVSRGSTKSLRIDLHPQKKPK